MSVALVVLNLAFAVAVGVVILVWRRRAAALGAPSDRTAVAIRVRADSIDEDLAGRSLEGGLVRAGFTHQAEDRWLGPDRSTARLAGPVLGDAAVLAEVEAARADEVLAEVLGRLLEEGLTVQRSRGRRVVLRRGDERVVVSTGPA